MRRLLPIVAIWHMLVTSQNAVAATAPMPQIWFSMGGISAPASHQSWDGLFYQPDAPWPAFMDHVRVVGILTQALVKISDADLAKVVTRLKEKHVALGIEMLAQAYDPPGCGGGVEGYFPPHQTAQLAAKLRRAGGTLQYIVMDEPLWFGHYYKGPKACHSSIENVAQRVAANLAEYQKVFPDVIIGDGEPFPSISNQPGWQDDYKAWLHAFRGAVGKRLSFTSVDIDWARPNWPEGLRGFVSLAHEVQMPIGIIYNANPPRPAMTNEDWLTDAQRNYTHIEHTLGIVPDWAVFASWVKYPGHAITDQSGLGEDHLVKEYLKSHGAKGKP